MDLLLGSAHIGAGDLWQHAGLLLLFVLELAAVSYSLFAEKLGSLRGLFWEIFDGDCIESRRGLSGWSQ